MKLITETKKLAATLKELLAVTDRKTTIPILSCCLVNAKAQTLAASNLELSLTVPFDAEFANGKGGERAALPLKKLTELSARLEPGEIKLESLENHWVRVTSGGAKAKLVGMAPENFPELPRPNGKGPRVKLPLASLTKVARLVMPCITEEESRYTLRGALLEANGSVLRMVATDGHRLALAETACAEKVEPVLIPKDALNVLSRLEGEAVEFSHDDVNLFFDVEGTLLTARKLTGQFPSYSAVLPQAKDANVRVKVAAAVLEAALARTIPMVDVRNHAVRVSVSAGAVKLSTASADYGEFEESVPAETSGALTIGFNAAYLADGLKLAEGDVTIEMKDENSAALCTTGAGFQYVIMPMRA